MSAPDGCAPPLLTLADACQEALAYRFKDPALLAQALGILTPPLTPGQAAVRQRLEFLGDAAWNFAVADTAFRLWPHANAGDLTRLRATWSSRSGLARLARHLGLPLPEAPGALPSGDTPGEAFPPASTADALSLPAPVPTHDHEGILPCPVAGALAEVSAVTTPATSLPMPSSSGPDGPSERVVAELFEAILGAVVLDGGLDPVRDLAGRVISRVGGPAALPPMDPKSALQILAQSRFGTLPVYRLLDRRGPPHQPIFRVEVTVRGGACNVSAQAEGSSRQAAERDAARQALSLFSD